MLFVNSEPLVHLGKDFKGCNLQKKQSKLLQKEFFTIDLSSTAAPSQTK